MTVASEQLLHARRVIVRDRVLAEGALALGRLLFEDVARERVPAANLACAGQS
jgi:hypothetical protein